MNILPSLVGSIVWYFIAFILIKIVHWILIKDIYKKYIFIDWLILSIYFWLIFWISKTISLDTSPWEDAIIILIGIFLIPSIYSISKKSFLSSHPHIANEYYPVWEFIIFTLSLILWMAISSNLNTLLFWTM